MRKILVLIALFTLPLALFAQGQAKVGANSPRDPNLQEQGIDPGKDFPFAVGDTIIISKDYTHYLTGEKCANWVYFVKHTIQQVGGKRFPNGILIAGIYSWVEPQSLLLVSPVDRGDSTLNAIAQERVKQDEQGYQERREEVGRLDEVSKQVVDTLSKLTGTKPIEELDEQPLSHEDSVRRQYAQDFDEKAFVDKINEEAKQKEEAAKQAETDSVAERIRQERMGKQHRFSIGLRGGVASLMQTTIEDVQSNWKAGFDALLDLQCAYYFGAKEGKKCNMGIITGVSFGYSRSPMHALVDTCYDAPADPNVTYAVHVDTVNERDGQFQLEVPILFSLRHESGFFLNAGPKLVVPVYSHYKQTLSDNDNTVIDAYFKDIDVHVPNELVTGKLQEQDYTTKGKWDASKIHIMLTAELGYEWLLRNGNALGLGVYANYSLYDLYKNNTDTKSLVYVSQPAAGGADVDVFSATNTYANGLGFFDCGMKLIYHFCFPVKK